jgi:LacI family transcriptional regulator
MKDVAALSGVSIKSVSRVVNNEPHVSEDIESRVRGAIDQLGFHPDARAGSLRRSGGVKSEAIGFVVSSIANPFAAAINRGVEKVATERGMAVVASSTDDDPDREESAVYALLRRRVDGLILATVCNSHGYLLSEHQYGTPLVFVGREPSGVEADAVVSDYAVGAGAATKHLVQQGHRRIVFLGIGPDSQSARECQGGFRSAIRQSGVPASETPLITDLHDEHDAERRTIRLLTSHSPPTAIFSSQSVVTVGALRALQQLGLQHPVALVGFDDLPLADLTDPGVTVIAQHPYSIGTQAATRLFARMDGDNESAQTVVIPTTLIPRGSGEIPPQF